MKTEKVFYILASVFLITLGACGGILMGYFLGIHKHSTPLQIQTETLNTVPVIHLSPIENGILPIQNMSSEVRIVVDQEEISVLPNDTHQVDIAPILPMLKTLPAPAGSQWVASKRGKKYWPLDSYQAFSLSWKNRVFYKTEEEARSDGKTKGLL